MSRLRTADAELEDAKQGQRDTGKISKTADVAQSTAEEHLSSLRKALSSSKRQLLTLQKKSTEVKRSRGRSRVHTKTSRPRLKTAS